MKHKPQIVRIHSENNEFQHAETLRRNRLKRHKNNTFFVEGVKSINLAVENDWEIDTFLYSYEKKLSNWAETILGRSLAKRHIEMPEKLIAKLSGKDAASELIALIRMKEDSLDRIKINEDLLVVVLDRATSPGNLGTIIRSCNSFEADAIIMTGHSVDLYDPKTIQASVGTIFSIPVIRLESHMLLLPWIHEIRSKFEDFTIIGTSARADTTVDGLDFKRPLMLLIGNETQGLSRAYKEICDTLAKIPIKGSASSLNVACAASIFLYELNRKR